MDTLLSQKDARRRPKTTKACLPWSFVLRHWSSKCYLTRRLDRDPVLASAKTILGAEAPQEIVVVGDRLRRRQHAAIGGRVRVGRQRHIVAQRHRAQAGHR